MMISIYFRTLRSKLPKNLTTPRKGAWIHVDMATEKDLDTISPWLGLTSADLQDSLDIHEIPHLENENGQLVIFLRNPAQVTANLYTESLTVILNPNYLVTISPQKNPLIKSLVDASMPATTQQTRLLLVILLKIARTFTSEVRRVGTEVFHTRRSWHNITDNHINSLIENEEILNQYQAALGPMEMVLGQVLSGKYLKLRQEDKELFDDVQLEVNQAQQLGQITLRSIISLRNAYQSIFTNRLNKQIKFLTSFTIILTIPTMISSFFGMNVELPLHTPAAFGILLWITLAAMLGAYAWFYWRRWL